MVLSILFCIILIIQPITSYAYTYASIGYVPVYRQPSDLTCWSTCVTMAASYFNGDTKNRQADIQLDAFPGDPYRSDDQYMSATIKEMTNGKWITQGIWNTHLYNSYLSKTAVLYQLNNLVPIISQTVQRGAPAFHEVLIYAYDETINKLSINDPASGQKTIDYDYFKDNPDYYWTRTVINS